MRSTRLRIVPNVAFETIPAELLQTTEQVTVKPAAASSDKTGSRTVSRSLDKEVINS